MMSGFGQALEDRIIEEERIKRDREKIEVMLRNGLKVEDVAKYGDYPIDLVKEIEANLFVVQQIHYIVIFKDDDEEI